MATEVPDISKFTPEQMQVYLSGLGGAGLVGGGATGLPAGMSPGWGLTPKQAANSRFMEGPSGDGAGGATLEQLIDAQKTAQLDPQGNYTYIQNPATGEWEIAYSVAQENTFQPVGDGFGGYIDPANGRPVAPSPDVAGQWIYLDGQGGTPTTSQLQMIPQSVWEQLQSDPNLLGPGITVGKDRDRSVIQQYVPDSETGLDALMENYATPALAAAFTGGAFGGFGIPGAAASGLPGILSAATSGVPGVAGTENLADFGSFTGATDPYLAGSAVGTGTLAGTAAGAGGATAGGATGGAGTFELGELGGVGVGEAGGIGQVVGAGTAAAGTGLAKILAAATGLPEWVFDAAGKAIPGLIGAYAAGEQGDALSDLAGREDARIREFMAYGAPSRERYEASFAPDFDINSLAGLQGAMDTSADTLLRRLSAEGGNPYGNPGGLAEVQKYITGNVALPYLQNYRNQNAATGGYGAFNTTAAGGGNTNALNLAELQAGSNVWGGLADSAASIFTPKSTLEELLAKLKGSETERKRV